MKTEQLEHYMLNDPYISSFYGGVVALDQIPSLIEKPTIFIVNTDPAALPGTHWLSVFFNFGFNEHFDSSGHLPSLALQQELISQGPLYMYNTMRVQSFTSDTCGQFCLFFCYFRCRGYSFTEIMNMFTSSLELNESIVSLFYSLTK